MAIMTSRKVQATMVMAPTQDTTLPYKSYDLLPGPNSNSISYEIAVAVGSAIMVSALGLSEGIVAQVYRTYTSSGKQGSGSISCGGCVVGEAPAELGQLKMCDAVLKECDAIKILTLPGKYIIKIEDEDGNLYESDDIRLIREEVGASLKILDKYLL